MNWWVYYKELILKYFYEYLIFFGIKVKRKKFLKFLKKHNVYINYINNIKHIEPTIDVGKKDNKYIDKYFPLKLSYNKIIRYSFNFEKTDEGYWFWNKISNLWEIENLKK